MQQVSVRALVIVPGRTRRSKMTVAMQSVRVHEKAWLRAVELAGGDSQRVLVLASDNVVVLNHPLGHTGRNGPEMFLRSVL